jgi:hypothetical protein
MGQLDQGKHNQERILQINLEKIPQNMLELCQATN